MAPRAADWGVTSGRGVTSISVVPREEKKTLWKRNSSEASLSGRHDGPPFPRATHSSARGSCQRFSLPVSAFSCWWHFFPIGIIRTEIIKLFSFFNEIRRRLETKRNPAKANGRLPQVRRRGESRGGGQRSRSHKGGSEGPGTQTPPLHGCALRPHVLDTLLPTRSNPTPRFPRKLFPESSQQHDSS